MSLLHDPNYHSHPPNQTLFKNLWFQSISQEFQLLNLINANKYHQASIRCKPRVCIYEGKESLRSNPCLEEVKIHYGGQLEDANNSNCRVERSNCHKQLQPARCRMPREETINFGLVQIGKVQEGGSTGLLRRIYPLKDDMNSYGP